MRKRILTLMAACLYYSGLVGLARWTTRRTGPHLIILNYHRAAGGDLRRHLLHLRKHYRCLHLEKALGDLFAPNEHKQREHGRTSLVLTFDDGYRDNYTEGLALARELQVPMTLFLIPGYIDSGEHFWWLEGQRLVRHAQREEVTMARHTYRLRQPEGRKALARAIDERLRHASSVAERAAFLASARQALAAPAEASPEEQAALPLTWAEVREMEASGWISFGAHTMHHPILAALSDPAEIQSEVSACRLKLEQQLGHPIHTFAYPVGQLQHVSDTVLSAVREAGYSWACTTLYGLNTRQSDPYLLRRIEVDASQHWLVLAAEAAGLWGNFARLRWNPLIRRHFTNASPD